MSGKRMNRCVLIQWSIAFFALTDLTQTAAFSPTLPPILSSRGLHRLYPNSFVESSSKLNLFGNVFKRNNKNDDDDEDDKLSTDTSSIDVSTTKSEGESKEGDGNDGLTFLSRLKTVTDKSVAADDLTVSNVDSEAEISAEPKPPSAIEKAQALRALAERTRLEAEKMDIMLTLEKISKLEKEMTSKAVKQDKGREEDINRQIKSLKQKLEGGNEEKSEKVEESSSVFGANATSINEAVEAATSLDSIFASLADTKTMGDNGRVLSSSEIEERIATFNKAPMFMKELVVRASGMQMENLNSTALIIKLYEDENSFNFGGNANAAVEKVAVMADVSEDEVMPEFSKEEIEGYTESLKMVPKFLKTLYKEEIRNNDTAIAIAMLEEEWKEGKYKGMSGITPEMIEKKVEDIKWIPDVLKGDNATLLAIEMLKSENSRKSTTSKLMIESTSEIDSGKADKKAKESSGGLFAMEEKSEVDSMVETLFPKSMRKEEDEIKESQAIAVMADVLAKDNIWAASGPPEKVSGGFLIRGSTRFENGDELIAAIDEKLERSRVRNQVNVFYIFDPTPVTQEQQGEGERPPVLFITAPDIARNAEPIKRTIVSSLAFGTIWYSSLLPFLLNDKYMKMADEQLALADASMPSNLDWLSDVSFPLFAATIGIQAAHELGHFVAASNNGLNTTIPTLVPNIATGFAGAITALTDPPKNKQALFDFAIAGPLMGMAVSASLLFAGMFATASMDASAYADLPLLPLNLLRQSSLVGGIIDSVTPGLLTLPDAALGTKAVSDINIHLHPLAIAGYFGMMINAANLLPVGRIDGGRIAMTLFGRSGAQVVSILGYLLILFEGLMGSDLLLSFFTYVIFFQSELEIAQRNEVDDMDFSRVLLATATGMLVLLTLIPM